jgi:hypothetical protein
MQCSCSSVMSRAGGFEFLNNCLWPFCNRCKVSITRYAAALSSLSVPRLTIIEPASGSGHAMSWLHPTARIQTVVLLRARAHRHCFRIFLRHND